MPTSAHLKSFARHWFPLFFLLSAVYALFIRLHSPALLTFYEDDAFYYFQIARNIVAGHGSTFDGSHLTNGYHPLWMLVVVALTVISSGKMFFFLLQVVTLACFVTTFLLIRAILLYAAETSARPATANRRIADSGAAVISLGCLLLLRCGMEITLTLPLALGLCWYRLRPCFRWTPSSAAIYGLLGALVVLSRLDAILLVALLFFFDFVFTRKTALFALTIGACLFPLFLYACSNHHWFHTWTTVSAQAKQLRAHHGFTLDQIASSFGPIGPPYRLLVVYPFVAIFLIGATSLFPRSGNPLTPAARAIACALIVFPFVQALAFFTLSDWLIWPWYLYSLPLASTGLLLLLYQGGPAPNAHNAQDGLAILQVLILVITGLYAGACTADRIQSRWYVFARDLEPFAATHPGIYAMGDCAGTTAYLISHPVVQLEGLVMDEPFLDNIRQQRSLNEVLHDYGVRYYITQDAQQVKGCYESVEPFQGGPDSRHMHGRFCTPPVASFAHGSTLRSTLMVFDLQQQP